ncbi:MAG: orotidine 5'-phosphate decarboxylase / HUMPS family protein [Candidatus Woesearchaeota archaeon]
MLDRKKRYLQIAFNRDLSEVHSLLPKIPSSDRILIEAGTPFIKREGASGIARIADLWDGIIVADIKASDGGFHEVALASAAGAGAATVLGSAPTETIEFFIGACQKMGLYSMIDMIGVQDPLRVMVKLRKAPDVVVLHKARDEETTKGKVINYKQVNRIRSKYNVLISAAGGVDIREARSAIFNGANIIVVNIVERDGLQKGITTDSDIAEMAEQFLNTIE